MSSSGGGGTQTTKVELPGYAQPYAEEILKRGAELSRQPMPQYQGELVAPLTGGQQNAINGINNLAGQANPTLTAANNAVQGIAGNASNPYTTSNQYIGQNVQASQNPYATMMNPYLDAQVNKAQSDLVDQYKNGTAAQTMAQFRNSGAFGGSAMQQYQDQQNKGLSNALTNVGTQLRGNAYAGTQAAAGQQAALNTSTNLANQANNLQYTQAQNALNSQNYQNAQGNALAAAGLAPQLNAANYYGYGQQLQAGQIAQNQAQNQLGADYQKWYNQAYSPYQQLGILQSALAGALGGGAQGVTTSTMGRGAGSSLAGGIGGGLSGAALGAQLGTAVPGLGNVAGAAIGGGLGLLGGIFG